MKIRSEELYDTLRGFKQFKKDDLIDFSCARCAACCKLYENILLKPFDIFRLSGALSLTPSAFIGEYCTVLQDPLSKLPIVKFRKASGDSEACHFLHDGRCSVHAARPTSCALYPLLRIIDPETHEAAYYLPPDMCDQKQAPIPLSEWLTSNDIEGDEAFSVLWFDWMLGAAKNIEEILSNDTALPAEAKYTFFRFLYAALYLKYDTDGDFTEQFQANRALIDEMANNLLIEALMNTAAGGDE